jgi:N utilization substance protein B
VLFEADAREEKNSIVAAEYVKREEFDLGEEEKEFIINYAKNLDETNDEIENKVQNLLIGWQLGRIGVVERVILKLAAYELLKQKEIGYQIVVNEAIELAKKYGDVKSYEFINGVLANIIKKEL